MAAHLAEHSSNLDRVRIATPCPISWEQMTGDNRVRFCDHCKLNVYNISELSRIEAESLIASTEGRLCAKLFRRADGTVLTKDCPVGLRALRMRVSKRAAAVFAVIASISSAAFGQHSSAKDKKTSCTPQTRITRTIAASDSMANVLSGSVVDPAGAAIPGAKILITSDNNEIANVSTNDDGRFQIHLPAEGTYSIKIEVPGFKTYTNNQVLVERNQLTNIDVVMDVGEVMGVIVMEEPSLVDSTPGTTIISGQMIRRLPIQ